MKAYFSYINARKGVDGKRGIYGRQIVFNIYDDAYNPAQTVQQGRRLVEQDKVFAIVGQLGTEHNEAIRPYLNANKVPQILNATGASTWFNDFKKYPWTGGWFPDYEFESRLYGQAIARNSPNAKIARPLPERQLRRGQPARAQGWARCQGGNIVGDRALRGRPPSTSGRRWRSCGRRARPSSSSSARRASRSRRT